MSGVPSQKGQVLYEKQGAQEVQSYYNSTAPASGFFFSRRHVIYISCLSSHKDLGMPIHFFLLKDTSPPYIKKVIFNLSFPFCFKEFSHNMGKCVRMVFRKHGPNLPWAVRTRHAVCWLQFNLVHTFWCCRYGSVFGGGGDDEDDDDDDNDLLSVVFPRAREWFGSTTVDEQVNYLLKKDVLFNCISVHSHHMLLFSRKNAVIGAIPE